MLDGAGMSSFVYSVCRYAFFQCFAVLGFGLKQVVFLQIPTILSGIISMYFLEGLKDR